MPEPTSSTTCRSDAAWLRSGAVTALAAVWLCTGAAADSGAPVEIPDTALRAFVADELGKEEGEAITREDMESLTRFRRNRGPDIADLTGLEYAVNLTQLWLPRNAIADLSPIRGLAKLEQLNLNENRIADLSPLADLGKLTRLGLGDNDIADLGPLAALAALETLEASNNRIGDLSPLAGMAALRYLGAAGNRIADLSPVSGLERLETLYVARNRIAAPALHNPALRYLYLADSGVSDLSGLRGLQALEELELDGNPLSELSPLSDLPRLAELSLRECGLSDLSGLYGMGAVGTLDLSFNSVSDLTPLQGLSTLTHLHLWHNRVSDLAPLRGLSRLIYLGVAYNDVADLGPLAALHRLESLSAVDNAITDLSPLAGLDSLRSLGVGRNRIGDLSPLAEVRTLESLSIEANGIEDVAPLAGLAGLWYLEAEGNRIEDIAPLAEMQSLWTLGLAHNRLSRLPDLGGMESLRSLRLGHNKLSDLTGVGGLTRLESLSFEHNRVSDLSPLEDLVNLDWVYAFGNRISDLSPLGGLSALQDLYLSGNDISDLSPLGNLSELHGLYVAGNRISDLSPLAGLPDLSEVSISDNEVDDLSPLGEVPSLYYFDARRNRLTDIGPLAETEELRSLRLDDNAIDDLAAVARMPALQWFWASGNDVTDLSPLAGAFGEDDLVVLARNPLDEASLHVHVPGLVAAGARVAVRVGHVPMLALASESGRHGFVRVTNAAQTAHGVVFDTFDDGGPRHSREDFQLTVPAGGAVQFTARDFERGNPAKGLVSRYGATETAASGGVWRLQLLSPAREVAVHSYMRGAGGHLAALGRVVPPGKAADGPFEYRVRTFVPADGGATGLLRLVNTGGLPADVEVDAVDDSGRSPGSPVHLRLGWHETRTVSGTDLEAGLGVDEGLGDGDGMWRLRVRSNRPLLVMNLVESADGGRLGNLHAMPVRSAPHGGGTRHYVALAAAVGGLLRIVNRSDATGEAVITAVDDMGVWYGSATFAVGAGEAVNLDWEDLRTGNGDKGLPPGVDAGSGHWRLMVDSATDLDVLALAEAPDGFLANLSLASSGRRHELAFFNPGSNDVQRSLLRLANWGDADAAVSIEGVDDAGAPSSVSLVVPSGVVRTLTAPELETGDGVSGALGDGVGKWRLRVGSDRDLDVMSLVSTPAGLENMTDDPDAREIPAADR